MRTTPGKHGEIHKDKRDSFERQAHHKMPYMENQNKSLRYSINGDKMLIHSKVEVPLTFCFC